MKRKRRKKISITVQVEPDMLEQIDAIADRRGESRALVIRKALKLAIH